MLNEIAWRYLQWGEVPLVLATFAFIWFGGLLAILRPHGQAVLNRAPYFALFGLATLAFSLVQLMWVASGTAILGGWLWLLVVVDAVAATVAGYAVVTLGRARSRDMRGDPGLGFLSVVPVANLWLIFAPGKAAPEAVTPVGPLLAGVVGAILGLATTVAARSLDAASENMVLSAMARQLGTPEGAAAVYDLRIRTEGLASILRAEAEAASVPVSVGNGAMLSALTADGSTLRFRYDVQGDMAGRLDGVDATLRESACGDSVQRMLLTHGARLEFQYADATGAVVTFPVTGGDCTI